VKQRIASFDPVARSSARLLILGSMPGEVSLASRQYYAHPHNAFWKIMGAVIGFYPGEAYQHRLTALRNADIALWDVLSSCHRTGALDAAIEADSLEVNDFAAFYAAHPRIACVCFNGTAAERFYRKHVLATLPHAAPRSVRLPSTSPAHAAVSFAQKLRAWRRAIRGGLSRN
jgi:double-stranded uracil-DNA glycosylase